MYPNCYKLPLLFKIAFNSYKKYMHKFENWDVKYAFCFLVLNWPVFVFSLRHFFWMHVLLVLFKPVSFSQNIVRVASPWQVCHSWLFVISAERFAIAGIYNQKKTKWECFSILLYSVATYIVSNMEKPYEKLKKKKTTLQ